MAAATLDDLVRAAPRLLRWISRPYRWVSGRLWTLAWSPRRPLIVAAAVFLGLPALVVMGQLQSLLAAMHLPGETAYSLRDLAFPGRADAAIETWFAHSRETTQHFSGPGLVTLFFTLVDTFVFMPAYSIVFSVAAAIAFARLRAATDDDPLLPAYRTLTATAFLLVPLLGLVDLLENVTTLVLVQQKGDAPELLDWALTLLWATKWALAFGILAPLLLAAAALARRAKAGGIDLWRTVVALRVQIALVAFFALFLFGPVAADQIDDVIRRWIGPDWEEVLASTALTLLLSLAIAATSWRLLLLQERPGRTLPLGGTLLGGVALIAVSGLLAAVGLGGRGLLALGALLVAIAALSYPIRNVRRVADPARVTFGWAGAPAVLASLPLTLLGLAAVRAAVFELVYAQHLEYLGLVAIGLALQALGWAVYFLAFRRAPTEDQTAADAPSVLPLYAAGVVVAFIAVGVWLDPWRAGDVIGTIGALGAFLLAIALLGYAALTLERRWLSPPAFLVVGIKRFPVLLIVLAWAIAAAALDPGGFHDVRTIERRGGGPVTLDAAWQRWLARQPRRDAVPLVLVAAEGGGIRAAYWTARALDCAIAADYDSCGFVPEGEPGDPGSVFAASGVSGGSLGLVAYEASVRAREEGNWADVRLGDDFVAATGAWMLFADLPNALIKLDVEPDRAGVLERAWQRAWGTPSPLAAGLFATYHSDDRSPLFLLNGTSVQDGCRVNTSVLDVDVEEAETGKALRARDCLSMDAFATASTPSAGEFALAATHDIGDLLCEDRDLRLSTAALLSARFPWVSPAGRVTRCGTGFATYVVDGGYFDTSAASPLQELWSRLEPLVARQNTLPAGPCVVPVLLQLDNHYKEPRNAGATGRPWESGVPLQTVRAARDARENGARQAAALLFSTDVAAGVAASAGGAPLVRYAHLFPRAHPGTAAPLGWTLSQASMDDLTNQLRERANANELGKIRRWFAADLTCARG